MAKNLALILDHVVMEDGVDNVLQIITGNVVTYVAQMSRISKDKRRTFFLSPYTMHIIGLLLEDTWKLDWMRTIEKDEKKVKKIHL